MKIIINIIILLFLATILACDEAEQPQKEALKYVIINDSENIIDKIYFHDKYDDYKNEDNAIKISPLKKGDIRKICPKGNQYITFRRELSKTDPDTKIYVTSSVKLSYKQGIIKIKLGDSDFYVTTEKNPAITCECAIENVDKNCITEFNECKNNPCQNGGSCRQTELSYVCSCPPTYKGDNCEIKINSCDENLCLNDSECIEDVNGYRCECKDNYYGDNCENKYTTCEDGLCQNGSTCVDLENSYKCECTEEYLGVNCEIKNICITANPCIEDNTIKCIPGENYQCECKSGYDGVNCENDIDNCIGNNCQNGSSCIDEVNNYRCECLEGYSGEFCECEGVNCVRTSIFQFGGIALEDAKSLATDSRENIYIVGSLWGSGGYDIYLTKLNSLGEVVWGKQWEGSAFEYGESIVIDKNDNIYIAGKVKVLNSQYSIFLKKIDVNGNIIWEKQWGTLESDYLRKITVDSDGNIFLLGDTSGVFENNVNRGDFDLFLLKISPDSNLMWAKEWGSFDKEIGTSILLDSNNNIYVTGQKESTSTTFITKFNTEGVESWTKQWGVSKIINKPLMIDSLNNPSLLRYDNTSLFITKLDNNGIVLENRELITETTTVYSTIIDTENNIYTLGANNSFDIILTKYNNEGVKQFSREWGTTESDKAEDLIIDGDYIYITGYTDGILGNENYGDSDPFLIKTTKW